MDRREFAKRCGILAFSPLVFPRRVNSTMIPRTGGAPRRLGATYLYLRGAQYFRGARPRNRNFSVDRVVFDDCCFQNDPCDRCKSVMDG